MGQLDVLALTELTHLHSRRMTAGHITLVGSMAVYQTVPLLSAYAAAKAYVLAFGEALQVELAPAVTVTVLSPGLMIPGLTMLHAIQRRHYYSERSSRRPRSRGSDPMRCSPAAPHYRRSPQQGHGACLPCSSQASPGPQSIQTWRSGRPPVARKAFAREHKDERRRLIPSTAARLFLEGDSCLPASARIAAVCGLAKGTIYSYCTIKGAIFAALRAEGWPDCATRWTG